MQRRFPRPRIALAVLAHGAATGWGSAGSARLRRVRAPPRLRGVHAAHRKRSNDPLVNPAATRANFSEPQNNTSGVIRSPEDSHSGGTFSSLAEIFVPAKIWLLCIFPYSYLETIDDKR